MRQGTVVEGLLLGAETLATAVAGILLIPRAGGMMQRGQG